MVRSPAFERLSPGTKQQSQRREPAQAEGSTEEVTIQGCVGRFSGDYILTKQDPAITYELQTTGKIRLRWYLGQRVEVTGTEGPSMSTSSDALARTGSASAVTLTITSIKTVAKRCTVDPVPRVGGS